MNGEQRENSRAPLAVALASCILALVAASSLVLGAVEHMGAAGRAVTRGRASGAAAVEEARQEALSRCAAALVLGGALLGVGGAVSWKLVLHERSRAHKARARARLARLGLLAGGLAQEIHGPLQEARELVSQLRDALEDQPAWSVAGPVDACELAATELERIETVLRDFLAYARPEPVPPRIVDLSHLLREWVATLEPELAARDVALVVEPTGPGATAIADPAGLKQIFWTVVRNARDAAPRGTIVRVSVVRDADRVRIRVSDRGPGIAPERRAELFEPFVSTKPEGMGLGLAVALRLAEAMGATLAFRGGPPGAVVEIALRRAPPAARFLVQPPRALQGAGD